MPKPDPNRARQISHVVQQRRKLLDEERTCAKQRERQRLQKLLSHLLQYVFDRACEGHMWLDAPEDEVTLLQERLTAFGFLVESNEDLASRVSRVHQEESRHRNEALQHYHECVRTLAKKLKCLGIDIAPDLLDPECDGVSVHRVSWANVLDWMDQELVLDSQLIDGGYSWFQPVTPRHRWRSRDLEEAQAKTLRPALLDVVAAAESLSSLESSPESEMNASPLAEDERRISWAQLPLESGGALPVLGVSFALLSWLSSAEGQAFSADLDSTSKALARTGESSLVVRLGQVPTDGRYLLSGAELDREHRVPVGFDDFCALIRQWEFGVEKGLPNEDGTDITISW